MRQISVSIGGKHNARVLKNWHGTFPQFAKMLLASVPETEDKASNGWVCGALFNPAYRDSEHFQQRDLLSLDYDHITEDERRRVLEHFAPFAHFAYTTWSHTTEKPRIRVWLPVSRSLGYDEFQAVSRRVASGPGIELAARESHTPAQYMFKPAVKPFDELQSWMKLEAPWLDVDQILATYDNWTDRSQWPHRAEGDGVHNEGAGVDPRRKPGLVGAFCRAFTIEEAIEKFDLPYKPGSAEGRLTYTDGSRPDGAIIYDDGTKLHSHHDTDAARGQHNAFDLVRLHRFGWLDGGLAVPAALADLPSSKAMEDLARNEPLVARQIVAEEGFEDLEVTDTEWLDESPVVGKIAACPVVALPNRIIQASSKLTDQENARRIQRKHGGGLLSVGKTFYCWTGTHWEKSDTKAKGLIIELSRMVLAEARQILKKAEDEKRDPTDEEKKLFGATFQWSVECGNASKISNCEGLLRSLLDFDPKALNADAHALTCANGTLDLRTGELTKHNPNDFITACAPIAFDPKAQAPRFERFLAEIYDEDASVVAFAKRWFGYCLTGSIKEHKMVFHVGRGGNGKGTLMDLLSDVLGPGYYSTASQKLLSLDEQGATPELAGLLGRRMVTIGETEENMEIREGLIKSITGGDTISARHLFKEPFEFKPTHKLQVFTNHTPAVKSQDFAMWRRIILLNYPVSYGDEREVANGDAARLKDKDLSAALRAEAPGVLRWLVEGAKEWYDGGLQPPPAVLSATQKYRDDQDTIGSFARERLVADSESWTALTGEAESIFPAYRGWCSSMNIRPLGRNRFVREVLRVMKEARLQSKNSAAGFSGIRLTSESFAE